MGPALQFVTSSTRAMMRGSRAYYLWLVFLLAWIALGAAAWIHQVTHGLVVTNMTDQIAWGAYVANFEFTYLLGTATAAVMLLVPARLYRHPGLEQVAVLGELLAVVAMVTCLLFLIVDLGRPDRFWHALPLVGRLHWPMSLLAWDVIALPGFLALNLFLATYGLYTRFVGTRPRPTAYRLVAWIALVWAVLIVLVTTFLYSSLGAHPYWHTAVLAPHFLASALVAGPALLIVALRLVRHRMAADVPDDAMVRLRQIALTAMLVNLFLLGSEVFTELHAGTSHSASMRYRLFGLEGHAGLVPYTWIGIALELFALVVLLVRGLHSRGGWLVAGCLAAVVGVWIDKGMGLVVPGFVPTPLGEVLDYTPSFTEFCVCAGIWSGGALLYTLLLKAAVSIQFGQLRQQPPREETT